MCHSGYHEFWVSVRMTEKRMDERLKTGRCLEPFRKPYVPLRVLRIPDEYDEKQLLGMTLQTSCCGEAS